MGRSLAICWKPQHEPFSSGDVIFVFIFVFIFVLFVIFVFVGEVIKVNDGVLKVISNAGKDAFFPF